MVTSSVVQSSPDTCVITCPRCDQTTAIPMAQLQFRETQHVRCRCGCTLRLVRLDQRQHPRTPVQLSGALLDVSTQAPVTPLTVIDLSLGGVRFTTDLSALEVGECYRIQFSLDDALQTKIHNDIVIRILHTDQTYGAEFLHPECHQELNFYLTPWGVQL